MLYGHKPIDSDERGIIELITSFTHGHTELPDLGLFWGLLFDPVRYEGIEQYNGFYCAINILRQEVGLERKGKPGDYDLIFIPYQGDYLFYDRTAVFEVKVVRPSFDRQTRSPNSFGETQVYGLLEDGFPLVGLLHVIVAEPLKNNQLGNIMMSKLPAKGGREEGDPPLPPIKELYEKKSWDWLPSDAIDRQMRRLITAGFPKYVAIDTFALMKGQGGSISTIVSKEYNGFTSGYFNPKKKSETIEKVAAHFLRYGTSRYRKIPVWKF